jgi:hypothetical protein
MVDQDWYGCQRPFLLYLFLRRSFPVYAHGYCLEPIHQGQVSVIHCVPLGDRRFQHHIGFLHPPDSDAASLRAAYGHGTAHKAHRNIRSWSIASFCMNLFET